MWWPEQGLPSHGWPSGTGRHGIDGWVVASNGTPLVPWDPWCYRRVTAGPNRTHSLCGYRPLRIDATKLYPKASLRALVAGLHRLRTLPVLAWGGITWDRDLRFQVVGK